MDETSSNLGLIVGGLVAVFAVVAILSVAFPGIATSVVTFIKGQLPS